MLSSADKRIEVVARDLALHGVAAGYLVPTDTGLRKSILDAISAFRAYLKHEGIHDFEAQGQGPEQKRVVACSFVLENSLKPAKASLYRPHTKNGDPRIWFAGLPNYAQAGNLLVIFACEGTLYVVNSSNARIWATLGQASSPLALLVRTLAGVVSDTAKELLDKLRVIGSRGYIPSIRVGDTGVGATLEAALGISGNSSKSPDYKGIELKASRRTPGKPAKNRVSLFSQVPDWAASRCKSGTAILQAYGYDCEGRKQLYCTVDASPNRRGLYLQLEPTNGLLENNCLREGSRQNVCVWNMDLLRTRLLEKHRETFWVKAKARGARGLEEFHYVEVEHTQRPLVSNLDQLIANGLVTFDFTLSETPSGAARDHGYLFKAWPKDFGLLFPPSKTYSLLQNGE